MAANKTEVLDTRRAGVLLPVTSLPAEDNQGLGDFGGACRFIDFLAASGMSVWQILPLGPTHKDLSPYLCTSSHAGNPLLIDLQWLRDMGWLSDTLKAGQFASISEFRLACLQQAFEQFNEQPTHAYHHSYQVFIHQHHDWLKDFARFTAIGRYHQGAAWMDWEPALRDREPAALGEIEQTLYRQIEQVKFEQCIFYSQWQQIKTYAHRRGILLFGDMPLFVAHDSAEVWANRHYFRVNRHGAATVLAGVPPDYFSACGQLWETPVYNWPQHQKDGFQWWIERLATQMELYDLIRIDHFRGLDACWEIAMDAGHALAGHWQKTPGLQLLQTLQQHFGHLPLVAEDLGFITEAVRQLRQRFQLPGMAVMQFAFDGGDNNPYLIQHHDKNTVVYTGTHDNDTTLAWYQALAPSMQKRVDTLINRPTLSMPWSLIDYTLASDARLVIIPIQDLLALGAGHRLNTPGTTSGNWCWQFAWQQLGAGLPERLQQLTKRHQRQVLYL